MTETVTLDRQLEALGEGVATIYERTMSAAEQQSAMIREVGAAERDKFVASTTASHISYGRDHSFATTVKFAADELERIVDLNGAGLTNHSQREFADSLREDRHPRARRILLNILEDPAVKKFWDERAHYYRPPQLSITERRDLEHLIKNYFKSLPTAAALVEELRTAPVAHDR